VDSKIIGIHGRANFGGANFGVLIAPSVLYYVAMHSDVDWKDANEQRNG
jgi:hypothetical protein